MILNINLSGYNARAVTVRWALVVQVEPSRQAPVIWPLRTAGALRLLCSTTFGVAEGLECDAQEGD